LAPKLLFPTLLYTLLLYTPPYFNHTPKPPIVKGLFLLKSFNNIFNFDCSFHEEIHKYPQNKQLNKLGVASLSHHHDANQILSFVMAPQVKNIENEFR
jgi:hypothetical protein